MNTPVTPITNRFTPLNTQNSDTPRRNSLAGKKKATSPLEADSTNKKAHIHIDSSGSDDSDSEMDITLTIQSQTQETQHAVSTGDSGAGLVSKDPSVSVMSVQSGPVITLEQPMLATSASEDKAEEQQTQD